MLGIGFYELIVVFIIFVILFKPNEIISILFKLGKLISKIKNFSADISSKIEEINVLGNPDDYFLKNSKEKKNKTTIDTKVDDNKH